MAFSLAGFRTQFNSRDLRNTQHVDGVHKAAQRGGTYIAACSAATGGCERSLKSSVAVFFAIADSGPATCFV